MNVGEVAGWARPPAALIHQARVRALSLSLSLSPSRLQAPIHHSRHQHAAPAASLAREAGRKCYSGHCYQLYSSTIWGHWGLSWCWCVDSAAEFLRVCVRAEAAASLLSRVTAMASKKRNQYTLVRVIFRARPGRDVASTHQCQAGSCLGQSRSGETHVH